MSIKCIKHFSNRLCTRDAFTVRFDLGRSAWAQGALCTRAHCRPSCKLFIHFKMVNATFVPIIKGASTTMGKVRFNKTTYKGSDRSSASVNVEKFERHVFVHVLHFNSSPEWVSTFCVRSISF